MELAEVARTAGLLVRAGGRPCAFALSSVIETMRPVPVARETAAPPFVRGTAVIRGMPTPVLDLGVLLAGGTPTAPGRYVTLRLATAGSHPHQVALAVDEVLAVHDFDADKLSAEPGVLSLLERETIAELREFAPQLLVLFETKLRVLSTDPRAPAEAKEVFP
jgi:purine-binding chemotaxis protein CheW